MPKVSINILTKNRAELLKKALLSLVAQSFKDFEIVIVNDGSTDNTMELVAGLKLENFKVIDHSESFGITISRQEALLESKGEYIAVVDDDDEWTDPDKLKKQVEYLNANPETVLVGGGIAVIKSSSHQVESNKLRPQTDEEIRKTMLLRNNFFTSTVMFRRQAAVEAGGFVKDDIDLDEDYDLWLRLGKIGKMYNFQEVFVNYSAPSYNKPKFRSFLQKQLYLIKRYKKDYPGYFFAAFILRLRLIF